ncbi:MAG: signal peptidase I [Armatimonadetes bacterium]|nr:signal peptidase I [Armatimonadota bacterium]
MRILRPVYRTLLRLSLPMMALVLVNNMFKICVVMGSSMEPTYRDRQLVVVDRHYYQKRPVRAGDVVIFRSNDNVFCVKRVYAVSGEVVPCYYHKVDGSRIDTETLTLSRLLRSQMAVRRDILVPPGYVYVLGDNPLTSEDSRDFGPIPIDSIWGKVMN